MIALDLFANSHLDDAPDAAHVGAPSASVAVATLAHLGDKLTPVTGRPEQHDYLCSLGATNCFTCEETSEAPEPLEAEKFASAVDPVGSTRLAKVIAQTKY
ncbi:MAG: acrylyl-CoA reductase (NADPH) [Ilumatobacter sp.]|jgi:acrylyl-CoA reductase (NADPH)